MYAPTITPSIEVTIGRETRLYHAFITTAPARLDAPATVTLHTGAALGRVGHGCGPDLARSDARKCIRRGSCSWTAPSWPGSARDIANGRHLFAPADPVLVGLNTLQHWLWNRIGSPATDLALANA